MKNTNTYILKYNLVNDLAILVKFRLSLMVIFSSVMAYIILAGEQFYFKNLCFLFLGGILVTFAANAMNQALEREFDKLMQRTSLRPIADGRMNFSLGVLISGILCTIGVSLLAMLSATAATLGMLSFVLYAFVYTPLKRYSTLAVPVGAIPGALPVLIAGVAAQNEITVAALCLFGIQYLWQFPHYYAISWLAHTDYTNAGFKLVKDFDGKPDPNLGLYSMLYAGLSILLFGLYIASTPVNFIISLLLVSSVACYIFYSYKLQINNDKVSARKLMFCSIIYLPVILLLLVINQII